MTDSKKVLIIGGHGKVALLATPLLVNSGDEVTSLIRSESQVPDIEKLGATPLVRDLTALSVDDWAEIEKQFDVVVWSAGAGGRGAAEVTWSVDRDGALASIKGLEKLRAAGENTPRYVMVSYLGALVNTTDPSNDTWYAYVESKKEVDKYLNASDLEYVILGPGTLIDDPAMGIAVVEDRQVPATNEKGETSRELVARVITEVVNRGDIPTSTIEFVDGSDSVESI